VTQLDLVPGGLVGLGFGLVGLSVYAATRRWVTQTGVTSHGDSRWARAEELRSLRATQSGGIVIGWLGSRLIQAPDEDNVLVLGVQRSGKTSTVVVPTLLNWPGAAVATSTKEELVTLTGRHRAMRAPVYVFAPLDEDIRWVRSMGLSAVTWNPLFEVASPGLAAELAHTLTAEGKASTSPHWYLSAANLLTGVFLLVRRNGGTLATVLDLLNRTHVGGYAGLATSLTGPGRSILEGFSKTPPEEAGSVVSTARAALSPWLDQRIAAATSPSQTQPGMDLDSMLELGATLYLVAPADDAERCRPLFSSLLGSLLRRAAARARRLGGVLDHRLLLALDEAANFARVPRLASYVSSGPGQGIQSLLCYHDLAQLRSAYGPDPAATIWNNCRARLLLPGQGDLTTLEHFSRVIGNETIVYRSSSWTRGGGGATSEARTGRPLRSPDQLRRATTPILLYADLPPARLTARRWDQVPVWRDACLAHPGQRRRSAGPDSI
jgi:type IV secretory pathway TraG/TraD family ATPase VirD4